MKWLAFLLMCSMTYGQFPSNACSGCQLDLLYEAQNWPDGLEITIDWGFSHEGSCTGHVEYGPCIPLDCRLTGASYTVTNWSWELVTVSAQGKYYSMYHSGPLTFDLDNSTLFCGIGLKINVFVDNTNVGYVKLLCTNCERPFG